MSTCVGCSQEIAPTVAYCPRCGTPNPEAPTIPTPTGGGVTTEQIPPDELKHRLQTALGREFVVAELLGEGGFAVVFAAQDRKLSRRIAIKVLRPELTMSRSTVQRFVREAEAAASLSHPHILPIFFVGEGEGLVYFGMPLVRGYTLEALLAREKRLPESEVKRLGVEIAEALAEAHASGLVHRDIKPANVLLQGATRRTLVADFGIAKAAAGKGDKLTGTGVVIGSPHYMSPEQASGSDEVDHRSDIYSLGVVLWQMLTGELPFDAADSQGILVQHLTKPLPPVRRLRPDASPALAKIVERCCAKRAGDRYQGAGELAEALRCCVVPAVAPRASRRRPAVLVASSVGAVLLVAAAVVATKLVRKAGRAGAPVAAGAAGAAADSARSPAPMVAVLPFGVSVPGDTAQLAQQSARSLANTLGSRFGVGTVDINRLLGRWATERRSLSVVPDSNTAFAYSLGANQLVIGNAFEAGRQIRVGVDVYDTRANTSLGHYQVDGSPDAFIPLLDQLAESVAVAFCKQPEFNPRNLCFDAAARPAQALSVSSPVPAESAGVAPSFNVLVSRAGAVLDVRVRRVASLGDVRQAALEAVRTAAYRPARRRAVTVESWTTVDVAVRSDTVAATVAAGCQNPAVSLANRAHGCYDSRPNPRAAPIIPVPAACPNAFGLGATVLVRVTAQGEVQGMPTAVARSGCPGLDSSAVAFAAGLAFAPARKGGAPVAAWTQILVRGVPRGSDGAPR